ncbi:MAG: cyclic nucleotide-binding domain-containing protein [Gammaproteobacteria bacterium]|nr:cyclic nucleotide-binding domain-containing protein [Gammaproteobacteria bacterium]
MFAKSLRLFQPFADLNWQELNTVAQHTQLLSLPANRWLVRSGRKLSGGYYLLRGTVRCSRPDRVVRQGSHAAFKQPIYPGAEEIVTLTPVQLLRVDTRPIAFLLEQHPLDVYGDVYKDAHSVDVVAEGWETRFLSSLVMQRLPPERWQRLLRCMTRLEVQRGQDVLRRGDAAEEFLVLRSGRASVHVNGRTLSFLNPGDFFGEDALISGTRRNATVTMLSDGVVMVLPKSNFTELLLGAVVRIVREANGARKGIRVSVRAEPSEGMIGLPIQTLRESTGSLDPLARYFLAEGPLAERFLAAFLLTQQGFDASVLAEETSLAVTGVDV